LIYGLTFSNEITFWACILRLFIYAHQFLHSSLVELCDQSYIDLISDHSYVDLICCQSCVDLLLWYNLD
jgi:hypothetical protein